MASTNFGRVTEYTAMVRGASRVACELLLCAVTGCSGGPPEPDGAIEDWAERDLLVVEVDGPGTVVRPGEVPSPREQRFNLEWSIGHFSPPDVYLHSIDPSSVIAMLDAESDFCDLHDARRLEYVERSTGEQVAAGRFAILFNSTLDAHLALAIDRVNSTGASADEYFEGKPMALLDVSWFVQADGSGDFSKLCD